MRLTDLFEAVRPDVLYHALKNTDDLFSILADDSLKGHTEHAARHFGKADGVVKGISLTRSLDFAEMFGDGNPILVFDQQKLRTRYRIRPFDYYSPRLGFDDVWGEEDEEFVLAPAITPLKRYLVEIRINPETWASMKEEYPQEQLESLVDWPFVIRNWRNKL